MISSLHENQSFENFSVDLVQRCSSSAFTFYIELRQFFCFLYWLSQLLFLDLALDKVASQSSIAHNGFPSRAVDGNYNFIWEKGSCTLTNDEQDPWWRVDLGREFIVTGDLISNMFQMLLRSSWCILLTAKYSVFYANSIPITLSRKWQTENFKLRVGWWWVVVVGGIV